MRTRLATIGYWGATVAVASEMAVGGVWDLLRIDYVRGAMSHLGYPMYVLTILGVWKVACAVAWLVPGWRQVQEWAYAGAFFNYSWALRPNSRRLPATGV